jgi:hypothetical protein
MLCGIALPGKGAFVSVEPLAHDRARNLKDQPVKYKATHPILVVAIPKGHRTRHAVAVSIESTFDIEVLNTGGGAELALSYDAPRQQRLDGAPKNTAIFATDRGLYTPVFTKKGVVSPSFSGRPDVAAQLAAFISLVVRREARKILSDDRSTKFVFTGENGTTASREDKVSDKQMTRQPPISDLPQSTIDLDALRISMETIQAAVAAEFVIIDNVVCRRTSEPFYAVTKDGNKVGLQACTDEIPREMIAAFRLGRLDDARLFANTMVAEDPDLVAHPLDNGSKWEEGPGAASQLDDVGLTVAHGGVIALRRFKTDHHNEYLTKQSINRLMFETPLSYLTAVRALNEIIDERNEFLIAADADRIAPILEDIVSFGERTPFSNGWNGIYGFPYDRIVDLWNNQSIDIDIAPAASIRGPR